MWRLDIWTPLLIIGLGGKQDCCAGKLKGDAINLWRMCRLLQLCINISFVVSFIVIRALQHTAAGFKNIFIYMKCLMCVALIHWGVRSYKATDKTGGFGGFRWILIIYLHIGHTCSSPSWNQRNPLQLISSSCLSPSPLFSFRFFSTPLAAMLSVPAQCVFPVRDREERRLHK